MSKALIGIADIAIGGLITMIENGQLAKADIQAILDKADVLKAKTDSAVDGLLDAVDGD